MYRFVSIRLAAISSFLFVLLAGCETTPVETPDTPACPVVEAVSCPVCEITECPVVEVVPTVTPQCTPAPPVACAEPEVNYRYQVIGEKEWALIEPGDLILEARIDTGAETSSIHAEDMQLIEKDGKRWVRFSLLDPATQKKTSLERRLHRRILVKQTGSESLDRRYVVRMWITLGDTRTWLDVSLSDREDFEFPVLIGRNMLMDNFAVDVSKHHVLPKPTPIPVLVPAVGGS